MWYVIQTRAGNERKISDRCGDLTSKSEEVFVPLVEYERRIRGENIQVTKAMFPGYVFFDTEDVDGLFYRLKRIKGLTRILRTGDEFTPISQEEKDLIEQLAGDEHVVLMSEGYKEGGRVIITDGPLVNFSGVIKRIDRTKRTATLEVLLLGEPREVKVGLRVMSAVDAD